MHNPHLYSFFFSWKVTPCEVSLPRPSDESFNQVALLLIPQKVYILIFSHLFFGSKAKSGTSYNGDWRGGSAVKSTCCPCKQSRFSSQHPHEGSLLSVLPVLEGSDALFWLSQVLCSHVVHKHMCRRNTHTCKIKKYIF